MIVYRDTVANISLDNRETERRLLCLSEFPIGKTVARQPIEEHLLRMLQVEPRVRPSASILCQNFSQDYRLHIEWLHDLATSKFQACQFSCEEALEEATRRSLGLPMSSEPSTPIPSWEEQVRRDEARAGHFLKTQEREIKTLASVRKLLSERGSGAFRIYVRGLSGTRAYDTNPNVTISGLKALVGYPPDQIILLYVVKALLRDELTLGDYGIRNCSTLEMILSCAWGGQ